MKKNYRSKQEIITQILKAITEKKFYDDLGMTPFRLQFYSYLSFNQAKKYRDLMMEKDLIVEIYVNMNGKAIDNTKKNIDHRRIYKQYIITQKGMEYLRTAEKLNELTN